MLSRNLERHEQTCRPQVENASMATPVNENTAVLTTSPCQTEMPPIQTPSSTMIQAGTNMPARVYATPSNYTPSAIEETKHTVFTRIEDESPGEACEDDCKYDNLE